MSLSCSKIDVLEASKSSEDNKKNTKQRAHQTISVSLNEIRPTHDSVSTIERSKLSLKEVLYYGVVGVVAIVLLIAAALILISMISFLSGDFCVDHDEAHDSTAITELVNSLTFGSLMFGLVGAVVGLVLLVIWNPPFTTTTTTTTIQNEVNNRIQHMSACISLSFIIDGILLCGLGGILSTSEGRNENLPTWIWFAPYFLVGACMFAMIIILGMRNLVAPNTCSSSGRKQNCTVMATQLIFMFHILLSFPFGTISAGFYNTRYCGNGCMKLFSPYCTSVSEDE